MAQAQLSLSCVLLSRQLHVFSELQATHWCGAVLCSCPGCAGSSCASPSLIRSHHLPTGDQVIVDWIMQDSSTHTGCLPLTWLKENDYSLPDSFTRRQQEAKPLVAVRIMHANPRLLPGLCVCVRLYVCVCVYMCVVKKHACLRLTVRNSPQKRTLLPVY